MTSSTSGGIEITVNGVSITVEDDSLTLLDVLRGQVGDMSVKDGCSPQGQCGCCTVLVDGQPRVSCVTPVRRVRGRTITTAGGLETDIADAWADAFVATGASQCGFCTPGIVCRFEGLRSKGAASDDRAAASEALLAHTCRCTGWQPIVDAWTAFGRPGHDVDLAAAAARAAIEGRTNQVSGPRVALGHAGFADDTAPADALVAVKNADDTDWVIAETRAEAIRMSGKVQGRRTTSRFDPPIDLPEGSFDICLQTSWVEPAYLETDASWCVPGGTPASPLANGGAFGAKQASEVGSVARRLADQHGRPVRVLYAREESVRLGPKRPPLSAGINADGSGVVRVARTPGIVAAITSVAPNFEVEEVDIVGPPTSVDLRAAGWAEANALVCAQRGEVGWVQTPDGGEATAEIDAAGSINVIVRGGDPLEEITLRSYCIGAAHMALGMVTSESLSVDDNGQVHDLTVRSFGVLRAVDTPPVSVAIEIDDRPPCNVSDAVFAAVLAAVWLDRGLPPVWPALSTP